MGDASGRSVDVPCTGIVRAAVALGLALTVASPVARAADVAVGSYIGDGSEDRAITGIGFAPGAVFVGDESGGSDNRETVLRTSAMSGDWSCELTSKCAVNGVQALLGDGFQVGSDAAVNKLERRYHYVAMRRDTCTADLAVGTYIGNGVDARVIGDAGFQPAYVIVKRSDTATVGFQRFAAESGDASLPIDTGAEATNRIEALLPTGFTVGTHAAVNAAGSQYFWIAWRRGAGIWTGTYVGDGLAGHAVGVGGAPAWALVRGPGGRQTVHRPASIDAGSALSLFITSLNANTGRIEALLPSGFRLGTHDQVNRSGIVYWHFALAAAVSSCPSPTPTASHTASASATASQTATMTSSATATGTPTPLDTNTATPVDTATPTPPATATPTPADTSTPTATDTATAVDTATESATPTPPATDTPTATPTDPATARVFVSSVDYPADLGGAVPYDVACTQRAQAAGLGGTWTAWMSDSSTNAIDRMNLASAPIVRVDGVKVADDIADLTDGALDAAISVDEYGAPRSAWVFTGTNLGGTRSSLRCAEWTSTLPDTYPGSSVNADSYWTGSPAQVCWINRPVYCFEFPTVSTPTPTPTFTPATSTSTPTRTSTPTQTATPTPFLAFASSRIYQGREVLSLAYADVECASMAAAAGLPGTWVAWLSDSSTDARDRVVAAGPWDLVTGTRIADTRNDLMDGSLDASIQRDENGLTVSSYAWTGTDIWGSRTSFTCNNWVGGSFTDGTFGLTLAINGEWTNWGEDGCNSIRLHLYCLQNG